MLNEKRTSLHRFVGTEVYERVITAQNSKMKFMGFDRILLKPGESFQHEVINEEIAFVLIDGDMKVFVDWNDKTVIDGASGHRKSVFNELPYAVYVPPGSKLRIESAEGMEARVFCAPCSEGNPPFFCTPEEVEEGTPGVMNMKRKYRFIFGPPGKVNGGITQKLIVGESVSMPGGWVGFPAHRHDYNDDTETELEEIFSFKIKSPEGGYLIQHSYGLDERWDEVNIIDADDFAVALPEGYHTSMAVPGCVEYLLWGLAGDQGKDYLIKFDPRFDWLRRAEAMFPEF